MNKEEFIKRVKISETDCWEWQGGMSSTGYGVVNYNNKRMSTHRASYLIHIGIIPADLMVCHKCDNRKCVNPNHFFLGTNSDNMKDAYQKGRLSKENQFKKGNIALNKIYSDKQILNVLSEIKNNPDKTIKSICKEFDVSYQTIRDVRRKKSKTYSSITK